MLGPELQPRAIWSFKAEACVRCVHVQNPRAWLSEPESLPSNAQQLFVERHPASSAPLL